jgi:ribosomal protein S18 acetylase RimI-like enzyme
MSPPEEPVLYEIETETEPATDPTPAPGSTFRPLARFVVREGDAVIATVRLGEADVFERYPPEPFLAGITWSPGRVDAARAVVTVAADAAPRPVHVHTNAETHEQVDERLAVLAGCGFELFQEKEGLWWSDDDAARPGPGSLTFASMADVGREPFAALLAAGTDGALDRLDRMMVQRQGARSWAERFLEVHVATSDESSWFIATDCRGERVGYVGLVERDPDARTGTISHIGVRPDQRGRHYGDELLVAAFRAAGQRGFTGILSHTDVQNTPMLNAFARVGVRAADHPWHKWHHIRAAAAG